MSDHGASISRRLGLDPMEEPSMVAAGESKLFIGVPKERSLQEHRVGLTPESVRLLVQQGHRVLIEAGAGLDSSFADIAYSEVGAEVTDDVEQVYQAEIVVKVAPPTPGDIAMARPGLVLVSPIHLPTLHREDLEAMQRKRITALAFDYIRDQAGRFPFVRAMSEIAGSSVILLAAEFLSNANQGSGILLGGVSGVPPAKVVILGAGVVGTFATRAALGLGAQVSVFDIDVYNLIDLQDNVGQRVFTSIISPDVIDRQLRDADVLIGAIHSANGRTPIVVSEEMVGRMKPGSVVIDVSIDQGGCIETARITSHDDPTFPCHDVIHYGVPNIPSRVSQTASHAVSHILSPILMRYSQAGDLRNLLIFDKGLRQGTYMYEGRVTNEYLAARYDFQYTNLNLLFSARF